jgi:hypothetical protein
MAPSAFYLLLSSPTASDDLLREAVKAWRAQGWAGDPNECAADGTPLLFAVLERFKDAYDDSLLKNVLSCLRKNGLDATVSFEGTSAIEKAVKDEQWGAAMLLEAWGARLPNHTLMERRQLSRLQTSFGLAAPLPDWVEDLASPVAGFGDIDAVVDGIPLAYHPLMGRDGSPGFMKFMVGANGKPNDDRIKTAAERAFALYSTAVKHFPDSHFALVGWVMMGVFAYAHHRHLETERPGRQQAGRAMDLWDRYETLLMKRRYGASENPFALLESELATSATPQLAQMLSHTGVSYQATLGLLDNLHTVVKFRHDWLHANRSVPALREGEVLPGAASTILTVASVWAGQCSEETWEIFAIGARNTQVWRYWAQSMNAPGIDWVQTVGPGNAWAFLSSVLVHDVMRNQGAGAHDLIQAFDQLPSPGPTDLTKALFTLRLVDDEWGAQVREHALSKGLPAVQAARPKQRF